MITFETASRIWNCYREIEVANKLLDDIESAMEHGTDPNPMDPFGRRTQFHLGVPSGDSSHRLFGVAPRLAESVIRAHIASKKSELIEANEQARMELESKPTGAA